MKNILSIIILLVLALACKDVNQSKSSETMVHNHASDQVETNSSTKPLSPRKMAMANVGDAHIHIDYSSPGKRGRQIWNGLVAFDQVWVTGAHRATSIEFSQDVIINDEEMSKGKYAFFTIPGENQWTIILNENFDQHLADDYDSKLDIIRVKVLPEVISTSVESLTYEVIALDDFNGEVTMMWDQLKITLPFKIVNH